MIEFLLMWETYQLRPTIKHKFQICILEKNGAFDKVFEIRIHASTNTSINSCPFTRYYIYMVTNLEYRVYYQYMCYSDCKESKLQF